MQSFFQSSSDPIYHKMWEQMRAHPDVLQTGVPEGVSRVRAAGGSYAFIIESSTADYWVAQYPCDLVKIGNLGNNQGYGFVTSQNAPLLAKVNGALKALKANGELQRLHDKWWQTGKTCDSGARAVANSGAAILLCFLLARLG